MHNEIDRVLTLLAAGQHGVFSRKQALAAGATSSFINRRLASGRWITLAPGVYAIAGSKPTWERKLMAACLEAGEGAVASRRSADVLHALYGCRKGPPELLLLHHRRGPASPRHHRTLYLPPHHVTRVDGIPVTTIPRTVFDLASVSPGRVERIVDDLLATRRVKLDQFMTMLIELGRRGRDGTTLMRSIIEARGPGYVPPYSDLEALFFAALDAYDVEPPDRQSPHPGRIKGVVDARWPWARLIAEVDGRRWHAREEAMASDRRRDIEAGLEGYTTVRFVYGDVVREPKWVCGVINHHLDKAREAS